MKTNHKILLLSVLLFITHLTFGQTYLISNQGTVSTCSGTVYDSGGTGNYFDNENYTMTICSDLPGATVILTFVSFSTEACCDNLTIYNGPNTSSPVLVNDAAGTSIQGQSFESVGGTCLTLVWYSDGSIQNTGFAATISCGFPCQDYSIDITSTNPPITNMDSLWIDICLGDEITFTAQGDYPNNGNDYTQSDATTTWNWTIVSNETTVDYSGVGDNVQTIPFNTPGGYFIELFATDVNGCTEYLIDQYRVRVALPPNFENVTAAPLIVCPGEQVDFSGGASTNSWTMSITDTQFVEECITDDQGVVQEFCWEVNAFQPGQTITSGSDFEGVCMSIEHSFLGDVEMYIQCPNGQQVMIHEFLGVGATGGCSGTDLGVPSTASDCVPGTCWDYCFNMNGTQTLQDICGSVTAIPAGDYLPAESFNNFIGCPINGEWCVVVIDDWSIDDGTLCSVDLNFSSAITPSDLWSISHTYSSTGMVWDGDGINPNSGGNATANPTLSGDQTYTFTVTDDFGCTYDTTVTITVRPADDPLCCVFPVTSAGPDDHVCNNQYTFNATMATGNTGHWDVISGPGTVSWANPNSPHAIATVNGWGSYEFEWTEQCGPATCIDQDRVIIEFYPVPTTTFTYDPIMCYGDTITITYTGNMSATATYDWDFDGASVVSGTGIGPYEIYWNTAAMHSVELTVSENGCTSPDTLVNIINPAELTHTIEIFDDPCFQSCEGEVILTPVGGTLPYDYSWGSPTNILPNLCAGDYTVTVEDANGCTTGQDFTITEPPQLVINSITTTNLTCYQSVDGTISVDASGGSGNLTYLWSDMGYGPSVRTNLTAGDYCVTVEDENGCSVSQCVTLTQPDELLVTMSPNIAICEGQQTTIQAQGMGGTVPYTYLWDQGTGVYNVASSSLTLAPDTTTVFSVYVTDDHGCTSNISSMRVTVSPLMVIDTMLLRDNRCFGSCDGRAEIVMHGGLQPLQYSWGSPNHIYDGLCAGIYTVTVNDIIGCTVSEMFVIEEPDPLTYTSATEDATCYGYNDGEATIFVQGGVPPYTYLWPNGHDTETLVTTAGTYTVTVADDHDCKVYGTFTINQPTDIFVMPVGNRTICQSQSVSLPNQATGGSPINGIGYDFLWTGSDGSVWNGNPFIFYVVSPSTTTVYTLVATDSLGCQSDPITSTVYVNPPLEILSVLTSNDTVCPGDPAIVHVDVQGGNGGPYLMTLQDGSVVPSPFTVRPDTTTMYYITLADMCGTPSVVDSILIIARPQPGNVFVAEDVEGCPPFAAYFTEGTPDYGQTYLWHFGDNGFSTEKNPIHIYTEPGTYNVSLEVEDFFGCKHEREIENMITIYPGPTALFEPSQEVVSFLAADVEFINHSIDATDYYWFFGDGDSSLFINPVHKFPTIGEYEVMLVAESEMDCTDTTTRIITVRNEFSFYFPTSFTPNGDGMNDCARPCGNGIDKSDFSLVIYDRWGNLVFQTDKYDPEAPCDACTAGSWDGTRNGSRIKGDEILPNGMYHWYAEFKDWNGIVFKEQGTITLIR